MIVDKNSSIPVGGMGGSIQYWERGLDPWHRDAFPEEFESLAPNQGEKRAEGWYAIDWCGNVIGFIADGSEYPGP